MTKINVKVIASAKQNSVKKDEGFLKVYLTAPAVDGKANKALIEVLAEYLHTRKKNLEITKGLKSRNKTITILGNDLSGENTRI